MIQRCKMKSSRSSTDTGMKLRFITHIYSDPSETLISVGVLAKRHLTKVLLCTKCTKYMQSYHKIKNG
jgi:hypothetical protein